METGKKSIDLEDLDGASELKNRSGDDIIAGETGSAEHHDHNNSAEHHDDHNISDEHHEHQHHSDEHHKHHHSHHHGHRRHRHSNRKKNVLVIVLVAISIFIATVVVAFFVMRSIGKKTLYEKNQKETILEQKSGLKSGQIKYNGSIYKRNKDVLTFLIMGIDSDKKVRKLTPKEIDKVGGGQADALFLLAVNTKTEEMNLISINRNTKTAVDIYDSNGKLYNTEDLEICLAHAYGDGMKSSCENQTTAVSNLFYELPINGYIAVNKGAIRTINNAVGGVTLTTLEDLPFGSKAIRKAGNTVTLSDEDAYAYTSQRDTSSFDSATRRMERQKQYIGEYLKLVKLKIKANPAFIMNLYNAINDYTVTDISAQELSYLATTVPGYSFNTTGIQSPTGKTETNKAGFEEFIVDQDSLKKIFVSNFYKKL